MLFFTSKIDKRYYKILAGAFDIRTKSDYQDFYVVSRGEAKDQLENAEEFVAMIQDYISRI